MNSAEKFQFYFCITIAILIVISPIVFIHLYRSSVQDADCFIEKMESVVHYNNSKYLIFCEDKVLENSDSLSFLKFNSSDFYNQIEVGKTYQFKVAGWRIPFLSMYQNIISIKKYDQ